MMRAVWATVLLFAVLAPGAAWAKAPAGRYVVQGDVVLDTATKRTWVRAAPFKNYAYQDAVTYCDALVFAGKDDWRLPSVVELLTLVDRKEVSPAIDPVAFPFAPPEFFWAATLVAKVASSAWIVTFANGGATPYGFGNGCRVRCVR